MNPQPYPPEQQTHKANQQNPTQTNLVLSTLFCIFTIHFVTEQLNIL